MHHQRRPGRAPWAGLILLTLAAAAGGYDETDGTYFPLLAPPAHVYNVVTWDSPTGDRIAGLTSGLGDLSTATTFECDVYVVASDAPGTNTVVEFRCFKTPFYSGHAAWQLDLAGLTPGTWVHVSTPLSSFTLVGMDWSQGGPFQVRGGQGGFDVWLDNVGFHGPTGPVRVMIDGVNDEWGHSFAVDPVQGGPPAPLAGAATHVVYAAGSEAFGNVANPFTFVREMALIESLQGLLLRHGHAQGIHIEASNEYRLNLEQVLLRRSLTVSNVADPCDLWWLVDQFRDVFGGRYVLYDAAANPDSVNAARMGAYLYDAVMVDATLEAQAIARGLTRAADVRTYDDQWIYDHWLATWPRTDIAIDQFTAGSNLARLNEYAAAVGPVCFREPAGTPLRLAFLDALDADAPVLGWPDEGYGELPSTLDNSLHDSFWVAIASSHNTALYSALREPARWPLDQPATAEVTIQPNVHYVTFVWSDGDNASWHNVGHPWGDRWWASPQRGQTSIGWTLAPCMRDLGSVNVEYRYQTAATTPGAQDNFIAVGPICYGYPSYFSTAARSLNAARLAAYMADLDLRVCLFLDRDAFETPEVYRPYLVQPQIDALFYWDVWGNYAKYEGALAWESGKPIVSCFMMLNGNPGAVAAAVNARPTNGKRADGYSMIGVSAWGSSVAEIVECVSLLNPTVKVVTPEEMVRLIRANLGPPVVPPDYALDLGDVQYAAYGDPTLPVFTVDTSNTEQQVDGTPSTRFTVGADYAFSNMGFGALDLAGAHAFEANICGDGSGARIRLELYSSAYGAFLYRDVTLDFTGWRHFCWKLSGHDDGMSYWGTPGRYETLSSINIFQVSGSWNGTPATFWLDNARVLGHRPADLNGDGVVDAADVEAFAAAWLDGGGAADLDHSGRVDLIDWQLFLIDAF